MDDIHGCISVARGQESVATVWSIPLFGTKQIKSL